ncbi:hypothetical protein UFOVP116_114 [uncultured Caudovirales phage]|uniref:Uncharacterized protein n=1 Tax=uncultured Caudovirales phage TaxID=2100421 RepID=A0A6J5L615_9CAUD|nr:hypothetical protein UFOVP116_114 [uncultured Caudovirales phage]
MCKKDSKMQVSPLKPMIAVPAVKYAGFALMLIVKMSFLLSVWLLVKLLTRPKKAPKPAPEEIVIDYERLW